MSFRAVKKAPRVLVDKIVPLDENCSSRDVQEKCCRASCREKRGTVDANADIYDARPRREERLARRVAGNELREMIDCISSLHLRGGSHVAPPPPRPNPVVCFSRQLRGVIILDAA